MEQCACVDFNNRCDEHKDLVIGPNLAAGIFDQGPISCNYKNFIGYSFYDKIVNKVKEIKNA